MTDGLEKARGNAFSIENMEAHGAAGRHLEYIGEEIRGNRIYIYYRDDNGEYWFRNLIITADREAVPEQEAVFGKKRNKKSRIGVRPGAE